MLALPSLAWVLLASTAIADDPTAKGGKCYPLPDAGYRRAIGIGTGKEKKAVQEAEENARQKLIRETTAGFSDVRRDALASHIGHGSPHFEDRKACVAANVAQKWVDALEAESKQYEADVVALADAIAGRVGNGFLQIDKPTWAGSGCVAEIGPTLTTALRNALAPHQLRLVPKNTTNLTATRLRLELAAEAGGIRLSATLYRRDQGYETPLQGFQFPLDLFNNTVNEVGSCVPDTTLGLQNGRRQGQVDITLELPTQDGFICEGQSLSPTLRTDKAVYAQVFSVYGDETLAVWGGEVNGELDLGSFRAVRLSDRDEKLLVIAAPSRDDLGDLGRLQGFCRLEDGLRPEAYPAGSTIDAETYTIWPAGTRGCAPVADLEAELQQAQAALAAAPACR